MHRKWIAFGLAIAMLAGCNAKAEYAVSDEGMADTKSGDESTVAEANSYETESKEHGISDKSVDQQTVQHDGRARDTDAFNRSRVSFSLKTNSVKAEDGTTILYESYDVMDFVAQDPELDAWGNSVLDDIEEEYQKNSSELLEKAKVHFQDFKETFYSYSNYLNMGVARHDDRLISILGVNSMHSGGAHPITIQTSYNLDLETKECLKLEDVVEPSASSDLQELILTGLAKNFEQLGKIVLYDNYKETIENSMKYGSMTPNWYLGNDGLVIFFNQYEIAAYAAGVIKVEVPYDQLYGILKEAYFPKSHEYKHGDLHVLESAPELDKVTIRLADGQSILIGSDETVYGVQLSEVNWLEETLIAKRTILSMNELGPQDAIEIVGGFDDNTRSYSIEFWNGAHEHKVYYIHADGLSEVP